jgi:Protein-L-isoaspartate carboxylmethyltransferase
MFMPETNAELVEFVRLRASSYLGGAVRDGRVLEAMRSVDRALFLQPSARRAAYLDEPVDIGSRQTCSQPSMIAFMLDALRLRPGLRVLEVGSGSGYAAALLALLVSPEGAVTSLEILPELALRARANLVAASSTGPRLGPLAEVEVLLADGSRGLPSRGPYDRILLSAGAVRGRFDEAPLLSQLAELGILLYPEERGNLYRLTRSASGLVRDRWPGVAFVPLKGPRG